MSESKEIKLFINEHDTEENLITYEIAYNKDILYMKVIAVYGFIRRKNNLFIWTSDISENKI